MYNSLNRSERAFLNGYGLRGSDDFSRGKAAARGKQKGRTNGLTDLAGWEPQSQIGRGFGENFGNDSLNV